MKLHTLRRTASAAVVGSVAFAGLMAASPAHAAVENGYVSATGYDDYDFSDCSEAASTGDVSSVDFLDNGAPFTRTSSRSFTVASDDDASVSSTVATTASMTALATPIGTAAARIGLSFSGSANLSGNANAVCETTGAATGDVGFDFTLPAPMWATLSGAGAGSNGYLYGSIAGAGYAAGADLSVSPRSSGSATAYLPAGRYTVSGYGYAGVAGAGTAARSASSFNGNISINLTPVGAGAAPVGKGKRFATLGERSCATNSVPVSIKKAAKNKAKSVVLTVNNKKRATFTQNAKPKKRLQARTAVLGGIAPAAPATVSAVVTLKNGKKVTVSRTYLPCS